MSPDAGINWTQCRAYEKNDYTHKGKWSHKKQVSVFISVINLKKSDKGIIKTINFNFCCLYCSLLTTSHQNKKNINYTALRPIYNFLSTFLISDITVFTQRYRIQITCYICVYSLRPDNKTFYSLTIMFHTEYETIINLFGIMNLTRWQYHLHKVR